MICDVHRRLRAAVQQLKCFVLFFFSNIVLHKTGSIDATLRAHALHDQCVTPDHQRDLRVGLGRFNGMVEVTLYNVALQRNRQGKGMVTLYGTGFIAGVLKPN